ncbi:MAG TPA: MgtC/SapB family protein, partial [Anaerolineales bacterium]|nr:MgtC/SapB family protein [Anaerolineales bacterium]
MELAAEFQMLGKVVVAALLGGLVGLEREFAERPAGLRTHMLVGATSAFFVMLAAHMISSFEPQDIVTVD